MSTIHFEKSRSELKMLRRLIETACPSISELMQLRENLEPKDMFFREKLILLDSAIYTQEKSQ